MQYSGNPNFRHSEKPCIGVLLTNLGSPQAPTPRAVKTYLAEFLSDTRVVELPRLLWLPILHGIILNTRPAKSAKLYQTIWTENGSPLLHNTQLQQQALQKLLDESFGSNKIRVAYAMRYGSPSIESGLDTLIQQGAEKIIVLPLYPQYAGSTTGSTFDALSGALTKLRWVPEIQFINCYHDKPSFIQACVARIKQHWEKNARSEKLVFSFHGLPRAHLDNGDPYFCQCHKTARLLAEALELQEQDYLITFQSRFGKQEWLKPYTDKTLEALPAQGVKSVDVFCPGFASDCLETLEEMAIQNKELFLAAGGTAFNYIEALNNTPEHIKALSKLVSPTIEQWLGAIARDTNVTERQFKHVDQGQHT